MAMLIAQSDVSLSGDAVFARVYDIRKRSWPNSLMVRLADEALGAAQADAALVGEQFADGADAAGTEVIDIVDFATTVAQLNKDFDHFNNIARRQRKLFAHFDVRTKRLDLGYKCLSFGQGHVFHHGTSAEWHQANQVLNCRQGKARGFSKIL